MAEDEHRARRMWRALEPVHAVTYFAPESKAGCEELGTKGFWMSYCGLRAAPLGEVAPEIVAALFYNFHPGLIRRALPAAWQVAPARRFLEVRLATVDAALHRLLGADVLASPEVAEAAGLAREAAEAAPVAGRPLAAANSALDWPDAAHLVLWHAQTILREHRGDGHVAALLVAGLDPAETLVSFVAGTGLDGSWIRERRGWSETEWTDASARLVARGLLEADGRLTPAGAAMRAEVEAQTDALADVPWAVLGDDRAERLVELAAPLVSAVLAGDGFLTTNPMALRPLVGARPG